MPARAAVRALGINGSVSPLVRIVGVLATSSQPPVRIPLPNRTIPGIRPISCPHGTSLGHGNVSHILKLSRRRPSLPLAAKLPGPRYLRAHHACHSTAQAGKQGHACSTDDNGRTLHNAPRLDSIDLNIIYVCPMFRSDAHDIGYRKARMLPMVVFINEYMPERLILIPILFERG